MRSFTVFLCLKKGLFFSVSESTFFGSEGYIIPDTDSSPLLLETLSLSAP